jgi:hypothetical protein
MEYPFLVLFYQIFFRNLKILRLTFKVYDVLQTRIRACAARPGLQKCGGTKYHKGRSPTGVLWNPSRRTGGAAYIVCYAMGWRTLF